MENSSKKLKNKNIQNNDQSKTSLINQKNTILQNETLYINHLNEKIKIDLLRENLYYLFSQYGDVLEINLRKSKKMKGQAFIVYKDINDAARAKVSLNNFLFLGSRINVEYAKTKSDIIIKIKGQSNSNNNNNEIYQKTGTYLTRKRNRMIEYNNIKEEKKEKKEKKEEKKEEEEIKKPQKFQINQSANVKNAKVISKASKINKIKKMDFNFDFDSFNDVNFSDFTEKDQDNNKENKNNEENDDNEQKEKEKEKELEKEEGYHKSYSNSKVSDEEFDKKFSKKKAISSEDYQSLEKGNSDNKVVNDRIKSMGNSQAISSEDIFGSNGESNAYEGESMTDRLKDLALNFTLSAAEKAKQLKNKTNELINKVQSKFSGGGY